MDFGEQAVKKALKIGADEAEVYILKKNITKVDFSSEIEMFKNTDTIGIGVRVAVGKKLGLHATSILTEDEVLGAVQKAVNIAKATPEDPNWNGFNKNYGETPVTKNYDKTLESLEYEAITDKIIGGINRATEKDRKVKVTRGTLYLNRGEISITNNYNDTLTYKGSSISSYMMTKAIEGGESTGAEGQDVRFWKDLDYNKIADYAAEQALKHLKAKPIKSTKLPVIMKNKFACFMFGMMIGSNVNAENIQKGRSTFAPKLNTQIADERITITDNGTMPGGYRTRPFDSEGHPTQKTSLIEKGVLKNFLFDNYRAMKADTKSTGNARRDYFQIPAPSLNNFIIKPGTSSLEDMIKDTKKGFFIDRTIGEWLSRPTSGEMNATVTHGFLIENGELTQPVNNVIVAGNFFEILKDKIDTIGSDVANNDHMYSPAIKISEMTIAGK
ncbi:MAG: TldD/PmbA family protein [Candidatus Heimdallarchaeota archaeon]|nr:TldD/PmbA family protein [Candidatus Heimdallarchaeota archaeon]